MKKTVKSPNLKYKKGLDVKLWLLTVRNSEW